MDITILLKNGKKYEFKEAEIQKKEEGKIIAIYHVNSFRIIAEYKAEQISMIQSSK